MKERSLTEGRGYIAVLSRRKWIVLPFLIIVPLVAYVVEAQGTPVYEGSAQVFLNRQSQTLSGLEDPLIFQPERVIRTQAKIARLPAIAELVVDEAGLERRADAFLAQSSVDASEDVDLLTFRVRDEIPSRATKLSDLYARKYIEFRRSLDTKALRDSVKQVRDQLQELEGKGLSVNSTLYSQMTQRLQQLQSAQALLEENAVLVRRAESAAQVEPQPAMLAALGMGLAICLGLGLAFLVEALDTRIRDPEELSEALGLPFLGSIPEPARSLRHGRAVMLDYPNSADAEPYRMLRTGLEVTALAGGCRSIMVTSALASEGKSTTAVNLATALARTGRRVVLVDLDLRRPSLDNFFSLDGKPGMTDVAFGQSSLGEAGIRLTFGGDVFEPTANQVRRTLRNVDTARATEGSEPGALEVIGSGTLPPNPGEFMVMPELDDMLAALQERADVVIVDGPPLLLAGEALTVSAKVDALLLVARMNSFRRNQIGDLERTLAASPAVKLGIVATSHSAMPKRAYYGTPVWVPPRKREQDDGGSPDIGRPTSRGQADVPIDIAAARQAQPSVGGRRSWT